MTTAESTHPPDVFPVDTYKDAARHLRRPFTHQAVKFKVQATFPKANPSAGLIVSYIDARLAIERLNVVVPHLWFDEYEHDGKQMLCRLTVDGITRRDVGEGNGKGLYSDAFKRAAVKFGIGVSLYAVPQVILKKGEGLSERQGTLVMTDHGERRVRELYAEWLKEHGVKVFGEPLDHGDVEGSTGDYEAEAANEPDEPETPADRFLTEAQIKNVTKAFADQGIEGDALTTFLTAAGVTSLPLCTAGGAFRLRELLDKHIAKQAKS